MRYRIEFLRETPEESAICNVRAPVDGELATVRWQAYVWSAGARSKHGATGFQIRDMRYACVVTLEEFEGPPPTIY